MDKCVPVLLPGGLLVDGRRHCEAWLRALDGRLEERLAELANAVPIASDAISSLLGEALQCVGQQRADRALAASLCIADRQWLMLILARQMHGGALWLQADCGACGNPFDLQVDPAELPVQPAGAGFPYAEADAGEQRVRLRVPNGRDQERIAGLADEEAAARVLASCLVAVNDGPVPAGFADLLDEESLANIEDALDAVSPAVGTRLAASCPECRQAVIVEINPYALHAGRGEDLFQDVHVLARHYHWSEDAILSLTRNRRHIYLRLINRERGMVT